MDDFVTFEDFIPNDLQGNFIKKYNFVKEAAEANGLRISNISACLRGKSKTSGGYIWKYAVLK